jgi:threonine aldolase
MIRRELMSRMIVGPKPFIEKTRWFRKAFGGGVRQSGANAAAADYGLTNHFPRLAYTHKLARKLADGLVGLGCTLICPTETNMVSPIISTTDEI